MIRFDARYLTVALMVASAAFAVAVIWFGLSVLLSMGDYLRSAL